jgi:hypothetical protein
MSKRIHHQFRLLAEVRWHILRNSLRLKGKKLELAGQIFAILSGTLISLVLGAVMGAATFLTLMKGRTIIIPFLLEGIFVAWVLGPLMIEGSSPSLDFREIARYPVSFRLYYLLSLGYGLLDPWALLCLVWFFCIWMGIAMARPGWAVPAAFWFQALALVNLLLNRALFGALEPLINSRRGRDTLVAILMFFVVSLQIVIYVVLPRWGKRLAPMLRGALVTLHQTLPAGLAARGLLGESWTDTLIALSGLCGFGLFAAMLVWRQTRRNYLGEISSDGPSARRTAQMRPGWDLPWLGGVTSAIVEKEFRYARRDFRVWMTCISAPLMAFIFATSSNGSRILGFNPKLGMGAVYPLVTAFVLVGFIRQTYNFFSHDGRGFQCWLMSPVDFQRILAGKNLALGILMSGSFATATLILTVSGGVSPILILSMTGAFIFAALAMLAAGNFFSVIFPIKVEFGRVSEGKPSFIAVLLGLVVQGTILGILALLFFLTRQLKMDLLPLFALPLMILPGIMGYAYSLHASAKYVQFHAEEIYAALT